MAGMKKGRSIMAGPSSFCGLGYPLAGVDNRLRDIVAALLV